MSSPNGIDIAILALGVLAVGWFVCQPRQKSMAHEERELREYFRRRDAAEARGEKYPPEETPTGRLW